MLDERLKRRIAEALTHSGAREALANVLRGVEDAGPQPFGGSPEQRVGPGGRQAAEHAAAPSHDPAEDGARPEAAEEPRALADAEVAEVLVQHAAHSGGLVDDADDDTSLQAILDHVKDAIVTVDVDGRVLGANSAAARLFGLDGDELPGMPIAAFLPALGSTGEKLAALAQRAEDTIVDLAPTSLGARRANGGAFTAEVTVSAASRRGDDFYVLCMRDVTERMQHEHALRESEARYRALVENAPEAIVVFDVDENRFVDANENAARLFKLTREQLLEIGPKDISPRCQADGLPSFGLVRGYIERALNGGSPVFEWLHADSDGREIPCEVRLIRLPSSARRLIRASIIDITSRRRADTLAHGERRVLELIAANAPLERTLQAVVRLVEQLYPELGAALMLLDPDGSRISLAAAAGLPNALKLALADLSVGTDAGACGAAASLGRQVVVRDLERDALPGELRAAFTDAGMAGSCSTPIVTAGDRIHGTLDVYYRAPRGPKTEELDLIARLTQLAGIAIRRKQDETALRESEARYRGLFDNVVDGVFQTTVDGELISANPALMRMLGLDAGAPLRALRLTDFYADPKDRERLLTALRADGSVRNFEYRLQRSNGSTIVVVENSRLVRDADGHPLYIEGTITDITERKAAERALFREKERAQVTLQSIGDAVLTTDAAGRVEYLNPAAEQLTGWDRRDAQGKRVEDVVELLDEEKGTPVEPPVMRCLREGRTITLSADVALKHRDGTAIAIQQSAAPIQDRGGRVIGAVMVFHDASRERQLHRKLSYYASHDSLTGFINRREFEERLSAAVRAAERDGAAASALLYMDLDQFKVVNDTCGHAAGDLLLRQLAEILKSRVRAQDVIARLGGDEFAVLLADCPVQRAVEIADGLREAIAAFRFVWRDGSLQVGVSIGVVPIDASAESVSGVMSAADVACYVAKDLGRNRIHVYEEGDAAERHQEMQWVARINRAREEERLELFYQPIVPIGDDERAAVTQYELLLRMRDERGELVPPDSFIPAAERYNLMPSLDRWVITQVMSSLVYREHRPCAPYMLAVNLSGTTLNDSRFLDFLLDELAADAIPPGALCFEITETAAIANLGNVVSFMRALKERGCRFSLDDFGTGLSSLTYLKHLPVDYVKIDGQFIRNVTRDPADESMVDAIARMARALNIQTIAERVEGRDVLQRLAEIGIAYAQGYYIAVPQPISELPIGR